MVVVAVVVAFISVGVQGFSLVLKDTTEVVNSNKSFHDRFEIPRPELSSLRSQLIMIDE